MPDRKKSFILYADLIHTVRKLPPDKAGELFMCVLKYVNSEDVHIDDLLVDIAFEPIRQQLDRDMERYEQFCNKQSINGKRGGRPKNPSVSNETQKNPENPSLFSETQKSLNDNDNDNDNVNDNDIKRERVRKAAFAAPSLEAVVAFAETEGIGSVKAPQDFHDYYTSNGWKVGGRAAMKDWRAAFKRWTRNEKTYEHGAYQQQHEKPLSSRRKGDIDAIRSWGQDIIDGRVDLSDLFGSATP
jgi:hypothetical protein